MKNIHLSPSCVGNVHIFSQTLCLHHCIHCPPFLCKRVLRLLMDLSAYQSQLYSLNSQAMNICDIKIIKSEIFGKLMIIYKVNRVDMHNRDHILCSPNQLKAVERIFQWNNPCILPPIKNTISMTGGVGGGADLSNDWGYWSDQ